MHGDLKDDYEKEVLDARDGEVRDKMMGVMNVMCGNVEIECAYALFDNFNSIRHGRNILEEIGQYDISLVTWLGRIPWNFKIFDFQA